MPKLYRDRAVVARRLQAVDRLPGATSRPSSGPSTPSSRARPAAKEGEPATRSRSRVSCSTARDGPNPEAQMSMLHGCEGEGGPGAAHFLAKIRRSWLPGKGV